MRRLRLARVYGSAAAARIAATRWSGQDSDVVFEAVQVPMSLVSVTARLVREGLRGADALRIARQLLDAVPGG